MYHRNAEQTNAERKEAAAEIERLQQEATKIANERAALAFENERLRAELEVISHATDPVWMARKASRALGKNEP
jgi:regulator of replication initiation timing